MKMFVLAEMCDVVRIEPRRFAQDMGQEINDELNKKFANKVRYRNETQSSWHSETCSFHYGSVEVFATTIKNHD